MLGEDAGRSFHDVIPKWVDPLVVVEDVLSRFFQSTAVVGTIRQVFLDCFESPAGKEQCIPSEPPGEREFGVLQVARTWCPIPLGANLPPATSRVAPRVYSKRSPPLTPDSVPIETKILHLTSEACEGPNSTLWDTVLHPLAYNGFQLQGWTSGEERLSLTYVPTPHPSSNIDPRKLAFQRVNGSPDQAFRSPHRKDVDRRPVNGPSTFDLPTAPWRGFVAAPTEGP